MSLFLYNLCLMAISLTHIVIPWYTFARKIRRQHVGIQESKGKKTRRKSEQEQFISF